jgi:[FeFe] hydrogenase H-cluster maturation GTPase HydF
VLFHDTAGLDDASTLGSLRIQKSGKVFDRADVVLLIAEPDVWTFFEEGVVEEAERRNLPVIAVINKTDLKDPSAGFVKTFRDRSIRVVAVSSADPAGRDNYVNAVKRTLLEAMPEDFLQAPSLIGDLLPPGGLAVLVVPIDLQAPKGRLILPQVQTIRDILDNDAMAYVVKERELKAALAKLKDKPRLVVTDSQAFLKVAADTPGDVPMTSFSILFARHKGNLTTLVEGARAIEDLSPGDKVLVSEACTHHRVEDDIGTVKIPRWLNQLVGGPLDYTWVSGPEMPKDLSGYKLIIHCGACMINRKEMLHRLMVAKHAGVPIVNYGVLIAYVMGILDRTLRPFPEVAEAMEDNC